MQQAKRLRIVSKAAIQLADHSSCDDKVLIYPVQCTSLRCDVGAQEQLADLHQLKGRHSQKSMQGGMLMIITHDPVFAHHETELHR